MNKLVLAKMIDERINPRFESIFTNMPDFVWFNLINLR
jgi:hypothetical protein